MAERRYHKTSRDTVEETKPPSGMGEHNSWIGKERHSGLQSGNLDEKSASGWASWDSVLEKPTAPTNDGVTKSQSNALDRKEIGTRNRHHRDASPQGWASWDSVLEKPTAPTNDGVTKSQSNALDRKEIGTRTRHPRDVSPGLKGRHTSNHTIEKDRNDSHRHLDKGRSRSISKTRGRSRSRSLSRGREKGRKRSRSRGDSSARDRLIPGGDYARKSHGSSDRITGSEKSSQICRSFASGRCMKGSQCRFLHNDDTNRSNEDPIQDYKDGQRRIVDRDRTSKHPDDTIHTSEDLVEDQKEESWRNKSGGGCSSKRPDTIHRNKDIVEDQKGESWKKRSDHGHSSKHREDTIHRNEDIVEDQKGESWKKRSDHGHSSKHREDTIDRNEDLQKEESWRNKSDRGGRSPKHPGDTIKIEDLVEDHKGESWRNRSDRGHTSKHRDDTIRRNEDRIEDQKEESWRNKADHDRLSRHSYDRGHGSEPRDRKSIPCKDFINGNCRYGDTCRYSHTSGDSLGKGVRNASFDRDTERQPKNEPLPCKFFAAGHCGNGNCRFYHENPKPSSIEGSQGESTDKNSVHLKANKWDGPTWDDAVKNSDIKGGNSSNRENKLSPPRKVRKYGEGTDISESIGRRGDKDSSWNGPTWDEAASNSENVSSGWNEALVTKTTSSDDIKNGKYDDRKRNWEGRPDNSREYKSSPPRERGSSRRERGSSESVGIRGEGRCEIADKDNTRNGRTGEDAAKSSETMSSEWNQNIATKRNSSDDIKNEKHDDRKRDWGGPGISLNREKKFSPPRERGSSRRDRGTSESVGRRGEERRGEITDKHSLHGKDNTWNGPTWDEAAKISETVPSVWTETIATQTTDSNDTRNGKRDRKRELQGRDDKFSPPREIRSSWKDRGTTESVGQRGEFTEEHSLQDKGNTWNGPILDDADKNSDNMACEWNNMQGSCGDGRDITEFVDKENISEQNLISYPSNFNQAEFPNFQGETEMHEEQTFIQQNVSPATHVEHHHLDILIPNGSNGTTIGLNRPAIEMTYPSGMQAHLEAVQPPQPNVPLNLPFAPEPIADQQVAPVTYPMIVNEGSQTYADIDILNLPPPPPAVVGKEFNNSTVEQVRSPKVKQEDGTSNKGVGKENNGLQENKASETVDGKAEESNANNKDEKGTRLFKNSLIELVKEIVKPKWKEGKMTRDDHKTIVKKTVEKVTSAIAPEHVPKTQDKVDLYLSSSKPKITKLVQAYADRCVKKDS